MGVHRSASITSIRISVDKPGDIAARLNNKEVLLLYYPSLFVFAIVVSREDGDKGEGEDSEVNKDSSEEGLYEAIYS